MQKEDLRIVYMGTPDFAVNTLAALVEGGFNVVGVITNPDKPAGRGQKIQESPVKKYAVSKNLKVLQPNKFRDPNFLEELKELKADLQIVVAFKMLPEIVWSMPKLGTFNLHASLLPQYRGAAPINWAIINGEKKTGITTFFLQHEIDTGNIIDKTEVTISEDETAGSLHDKLMEEGAKLVVKTVNSIIDGSCNQTPQENINNLKSAPKIFKEDCQVRWDKNIENIFNHIRGLSPYPAAWSTLSSEGKKDIPAKIYSVKKENCNHDKHGGEIFSDGKTFLKVACNGGYINIIELQQAGKKRLPIKEFLKGFQNIEEFSFKTDN